MALDPALTSGGFALAGLLLGGMLQYLNEGRSLDRAMALAEGERLERLHEQRRDAYLRYLRLTDEVWDLIARLRYEGRGGQPLEMVAEAHDVERGLAQLENERQALTLLADLDTRRELVRTREVLAGLAGDVAPERDVVTTFDRLQDCMRSSIGLDELGHPQPLHRAPSAAPAAVAG